MLKFRVKLGEGEEGREAARRPWISTSIRQQCRRNSGLGVLVADRTGRSTGREPAMPGVPGEAVFPVHSRAGWKRRGPPVIRKAFGGFPGFSISVQRAHSRIMARLSEFPDTEQGGMIMSQVITNRVRTPGGPAERAHCSGRAYAVGLAAAGFHVQFATAPLMRLRRRQGDRESRSRAASCSGSTATASRSATGFLRRKARDYEITPCLRRSRPCAGRSCAQRSG